jgi:hypothetical protein
MQKAPMPTARGWLSTCTVDNSIYAIGGALDVGSNLDVVEAFDPLTNTWITKTSMPTPRGCAAACAVDGIIYVFGGGWYTVHSTVEAYDPKTDTWTTKSPIPTPRAFFSTSVVNGIIYTFGGFNSEGAPSLGNVEAYDPVSDVWTIKNDMPNPRAGMASYTYGGNIYCFGGVGYGGGPCYSTICKYDPVSDTWEEFSNMPYAAFSISSSLLNGKLYLIGGLNNARIPLDIVYEIDLSIVLPVELVSFTGNNIGGNVLLEWKTATELNNNGFEVQRKFAESGFSTIGFVKGEGTTTKQKEYSYTDKNVAYGKYFYRLKQIDYDGSYEYSNVIEVDVRSLDKFTLEQNYPNPFNPSTTIKYEIPDRAPNDNSFVTLKIYDVLGSEVTSLVNQNQKPGTYEVTWDASGHSSGVYYYQLQAGSFISVKKMILLR